MKWCSNPVDQGQNFSYAAAQSRKGLFLSRRPSVWKILIGYEDLQNTNKSERQQREKRYRELLYQRCRLDGDENVALTQPPDVIDYDVARTQTKMPFYAGGKDFSVPVSSFSATQHALRRILSTTCSRTTDPKSKIELSFQYVQGMNEIAGQLLYAFCSGDASNLTDRVEVDTFWCFNFMLLHLNKYFEFPAKVLEKFRKLLLYFSKNLHNHVESIDPVIITSCATRWIVTLFTQDFAVEKSLRIWDFLLSFGASFSDVLVHVAVALMREKEQVILSQNSVSDVFPLLKNISDLSVDVILERTTDQLYQLSGFPFSFALSG